MGEVYAMYETNPELVKTYGEFLYYLLEGSPPSIKE
jgi:hypothetical protein